MSNARSPWAPKPLDPSREPSSSLRQVVQAAIDGSSVAIGRNPHNARHLRDGLLVAPFGREAVLSRGTYFVLIPPRSADRPVVKEFGAWLRDEIRQDVEGRRARRLGTAPVGPARRTGPHTQPLSSASRLLPLAGREKQTFASLRAMDERCSICLAMHEWIPFSGRASK